jgi:hypothetical protein
MIEILKKINEIPDTAVAIVAWGGFLIFIAILIKQAYSHKHYKLIKNLSGVGAILLAWLMYFGVDISWQDNFKQLQSKIYNPLTSQEQKWENNQISEKEDIQKRRDGENLKKQDEKEQIDKIIDENHEKIVNIFNQTNQIEEGFKLKYNHNSVKVTSNKLECIKDDNILQWHKGDNRWDCTKAYKAVFGKVAQSVKVSSAGALQCHNAQQFLFWDELNRRWDCGSIGKELKVAMNDLSDADTATNPPTINQVLGWNGSNWIPVSATVNTDDQNLTSAILNGATNVLTIAIEDGSAVNVDLTNLVNDADFDITNEIQDLNLVGNNLTITNNAGATTINLSPYLDNTDNQQVDTFSLVANILTLEMENDGQPAQTVNLSAYLDNTDDQNIESLGLSGDTLTVGIEDGA